MTKLVNKVSSKLEKRSGLALCGALVMVLSACSGSGGSGSSNNGGNGDVGSLQLITPKTLFSNPSVVGSGYVVINNPTATPVKNIQYTLTNLVGRASGASIESTSAANCATVAAYSQCNVKITVPAGAVAGSMGLNISNNTSLLSKLSKAANAATPTMGVEQAAYNSASGADGITLSYYHTVINGTPYILVSGLVASANAGSFNNVVLVDSKGNAIPGQSLIGSNSGYTQGATFQILLPVPAGSEISQTIKVQTQQISDGQTTVVSTATASSTLTTKEDVGIAEMLPSAVYLSSTNPEQTITFLNTGDASAQLQQLVSNNPNVEVVFTPASLTSGATATATLKLKDKTVAATTGNLTLTYNNGQSETSTTGVVDQNVNPAPTPSPTPTPTPPGPSPAPTPSPTPTPTAAAVTITSVANWETMMGSAYAFTATISGGSSTVTPTVTGITGNTVSPLSCALDDAAPATTSCTFIVTPYTGTGNYSFWDPASIANSTDVDDPSNAYPSTTGISLQVTADNGAIINNGATQPFSITGTVIAPYVYLAQTGQTPTAPLDVTATTGADGNVHAGIPWAVAPSGGSTAPNPRFEEVDGGCAIQDNLTGLIWVKDLSTVNGGVTLDWNTALTTAAVGTWCGQIVGTWRVPNINELASLINYGVANQASSWLNLPIAGGGGGFASVSANVYWSSSSFANNPTAAWYVNMLNGFIATRLNGNLGLLFPVRGGQ